MSRALADVAAERQRQIDQEGCSYEHDDRSHNAGDLACAAASYTVHAARSLAPTDGRHAFIATAARIPPLVWQKLWPFDRPSWNPKDPRRDLVRAAALIVAEIEKLDRRDARAIDLANAPQDEAERGPLP